MELYNFTTKWLVYQRMSPKAVPISMNQSQPRSVYIFVMFLITQSMRIIIRLKDINGDQYRD